MYVVWRDYFAGDNDIFFKRSINSGSAWQPVKNISKNDGNSDLPAIAVSGSSVHVVWLDSSPGNDEIFFKRSTDNGATWSPPKNLSNNLGASGPLVQT